MPSRAAAIGELLGADYRQSWVRRTDRSLRSEDFGVIGRDEEPTGRRRFGTNVGIAAVESRHTRRIPSPIHAPLRGTRRGLATEAPYWRQKRAHIKATDCPARRKTDSERGQCRHSVVGGPARKGRRVDDHLCADRLSRSPMSSRPGAPWSRTRSTTGGFGHSLKRRPIGPSRKLPSATTKSCSSSSASRACRGSRPTSACWS